MSNKVLLGKHGERLACKYLERHGYTILKQNYRCKIGEMDIIAQHKKRLIFVEVKTRSGISHGYPEEAVNFYKLKRLKRIAEYYLVENHFNLYKTMIRFDCIAIIVSEDMKKLIYFRHIKNIVS